MGIRIALLYMFQGCKNLSEILRFRRYIFNVMNLPLTCGQKYLSLRNKLYLGYLLTRISLHKDILWKLPS